MADESNPRLARVLFKIAGQRPIRPGRGQRVDMQDRGTGIESGGDDFRRLARADERAAEDDIDGDTEAREPAHRLAHARHAFFGQRTLRIVRPRVAALLGDGVADEI